MYTVASSEEEMAEIGTISHIFQTREYNLCFTLVPTARVL